MGRTATRMQTPSEQGSVPKHELAREALRRRILDGVYPPGARLPTETELPELLNCGNQTVRRALSDLVREGLIVRRRGKGSFVAEQVHPPILQGRHARIGLLWHVSVIPALVETTFQGHITQGILQSLGLEKTQPVWSASTEDEPTFATWTSRERGVTVEAIGEAPEGHPRHPPLDTVRDRGYDGLLVLSIIEEAFLTSVLDLGLPTVFVDVFNDRFSNGVDQVYVDPMQGYREAVRHFASQGMRRIHFVSGFMGKPVPGRDAKNSVKEDYAVEPWRVDPDSYLRMSAYRQAMDECGLPVAEDWVHQRTPLRRPLEQLAEELAGGPKENCPEAVIGHNANQAEALIRLFARKGLPLAGAGSADRRHVGHAIPIQVDPVAIGTTAAELIITRMQRPHRPGLRAGVPMKFAAAIDSVGRTGAVVR